MVSTLSELVPLSIMTTGLADWETADEKYVAGDIEEQVKLGSNLDPVGKHFSIAWKKSEQRRRDFEREEMPRVMKSLAALSVHAEP